MRLRWALPTFFTSLLVSSLALPTSALAADNCPPGSWFCEDIDVPDPVADDEADESDDAVDEAPPPPKKRKVIKKKRKKKKKTTRTAANPETVEIEADGDDTVVIVREGQDGKVIVVERTKRMPPPPPKPAKKQKREPRFADDLAIGVRIEGAFFPSAAEVYGDVGMGGLGVSLRWRPSPYFAVDVGTDLIGGTDYHGNGRVELAGALSGIVYFNPQHAVQVYGLGGVHASHAWVSDQNDYLYDYQRGSATYYTPQVEHDYLGVQAGIGVEFRLGRHFALHTDLIGLVRHRVSDGPAEFQDPYTGETTDTSGAGMLRAGALFWW